MELRSFCHQQISGALFVSIFSSSKPKPKRLQNIYPSIPVRIWSMHSNASMDCEGKCDKFPRKRKSFDFLSRHPTVKDPLFSVWPAKTRTLAVGSHNSPTNPMMMTTIILLEVRAPISSWGPDPLPTQVNQKVKKSVNNKVRLPDR